MAKHKIVAVDERAEVLARTRVGKMARSQHAYVRGSTVRFYDWLSGSGRNVPTGPSIWICGDCHLGNLGPLADADGRVEIQIRDLDQTVIGNPAHDIIRLALSLAAAARGFDLPGATTARMIEAITAGYVAGLACEPDPRGPGRRGAQAAEGGRAAALEAPGGGAHRRPTADHSAWGALLAARRRRVSPADRSHGLRRRGTRVARVCRRWRRCPRSTLLDAAYWMKGCSSLGRLRYAVIARLGDGPPALLDVKEATTRRRTPRCPTPTCRATTPSAS